MENVRQYEKLIVWKEAHSLCLKIYSCTKKFPSEEKFGLISQMRRASYSVPMNIAEGNTRRSKKEKVHFIDIAAGSLEEVHYQNRLAKDLQYLDEKTFEEHRKQIIQISYLLTKLRSSLLI